MTVDAETMGQRVAEARSRAGLTQAELAAMIPLDRSSLAKIERGSRRISAMELARVADALDTRIEWFIEDAPAAIVSRRNVQDPGASSPRIDLMVERVAREVEFVGQHLGRLVLPTTPEKPPPTTRDQAEALASNTRTLLGDDPQGPLVAMVEKVSTLGLLVFSWDLGADSADAATILLQSGGVAIINGERKVGRRRLALAHELGHYLVADEYTVDWRIAEQDVGQRESLLDQFARALLLPAAGVGRDWRSRLSDGDDLRTAAVRLASSYRVDMATLARRLRELDIIGPADAGEIRMVRTTRADIVDLDLVVEKDELAPPGLPRAYERAVLDLYRSETVSAARALDLLLGTWDEGALPVLPKRAESEIWQYT